MSHSPMPPQPPQQHPLVGPIGQALATAVPPGWRQLRADYRAVGLYVETDVAVIGLDGVPRPIQPPPVAVQLFGWLRAGMYQPSLGTWFSASLVIDSTVATPYANFVFDQEPHWRGMPSPLGFQDELRFFPRVEQYLPDWLRLRAGLPPAAPAMPPAPPMTPTMPTAAPAMPSMPATMPASAPPMHAVPTSAPPIHAMPASAPPMHTSAPPMHSMPAVAPVMPSMPTTMPAAAPAMPIAPPPAVPPTPPYAPPAPADPWTPAPAQTYHAQVPPPQPSYDAHAMPPAPSYEAQAMPPAPSYDAHAMPPTLSYEAQAMPPAPSYDAHAMPPTLSYEAQAMPPAPSYEPPAAPVGQQYEAQAMSPESPPVAVSAPPTNHGEAQAMRMARVYERLDEAGRPVADWAPVMPDERDLVLDYLNNAPVVLAARGYAPDQFDPQRRPAVPMAFRTDGTWVWVGAVPYYLREHGLPPEPDLLAHIRASNFVLPEVTEAAKRQAVETITS